MQAIPGTVDVGEQVAERRSRASLPPPAPRGPLPRPRRERIRPPRGKGGSGLRPRPHRPRSVPLEPRHSVRPPPRRAPPQGPRQSFGPPREAADGNGASAGGEESEGQPADAPLAGAWVPEGVGV
ncbi:hypothetical protein MUK42_11441 [Musa troglodytarum]|uniref:Uncharacterized protein n=1 Tax=Musa troglodytarum TaxID=320322 RepID=A0A9E7KFP4_9LILI|nr:hypothetical protein MUK42_11441 [Musa troglodytarum]